MEKAVGAANWLLGKVLAKLSDEMVTAYMASSELGHNYQTIKLQLLHTQGLLSASEGRDVSNNPGLYGLLGELSKQADEAEDMLDELHYFMIQDQLDGTKEAATEMAGGLWGHALHGYHVVRHTIGNQLSSFYRSRTQDGGSSVTSKPHNTAKSGSGTVDKLRLDRVAMSKKIKSVIEEINSICRHVSDLLKLGNHGSTTPNTVVTPKRLKRPPTGSMVTQDKFYGRSVIFEKTVTALTCGAYHGETLSVLPLLGPGGIGKTTFTQHLYNDKRVEEHFSVRVWVCVSTDFDVTKLTRQILSCILAAEKEENTSSTETTNLDQLQKSTAERLKSKRFLIVLDDIWSCDSEGDWKNLLAPFTKGETKGSMILVTTRVPYIAEMVKTTRPVQLRGLEPIEFFKLFEACIFDHSTPGHYGDDLIELAKDIATKLKGSPLAANTVGRLLKKNLSREYWIGVLEKNEWQNAKNDDDIMPSLKISYDYLPFHLKKCFSYFALFSEDHRFYNLEITRFWIAIGIVDSSCQNNKNYLEELVDNGFLMKRDDTFGQYYVMHDLLHELSRNVSSQECVIISSLSFRADDIAQSIQHLSITVENKYDESFGEEMGKLKGMIDIGNLRTLMIFGLHDARIAKIFKDTFEQIKGLRVLYIAMNTQDSLPNNFSNLIHLQYLKISSPHGLEVTLPSTLSRFYHMKFLDLQYWHGSKKLPKDISRLVNLRHFHSSKELHSNIPEVGKMKFLQELKEFCVKKDSVGFELRELGELGELGGELRICNLETVASKREASDAKLKNKRNMTELSLVWGTEHQTIDDDVLDGLQPHPNLRILHIINPGVAAGPRWLCSDISMKRLESLHLEGVSWGTLPPFGQLPDLTTLTLKNIAGMCVFGPDFGGVTKRSFMCLKTITFECMPGLVEWVGGPNNHLFSKLELIKFAYCPFLSSFPFLECSGHFTKLSKLDIVNCPKLSQLPPVPHTSALVYVRVQENGVPKLLYDGNILSVKGYNSALVFQNMDKVEVMKICDVSHILLSDLQQQNSLRSLNVIKCDSMFSAKLDDNVVLRSVQNLYLRELSITGELFSKVLKCFPALSQINITQCESLDLLPLEDGGGLRDLTKLQSFDSFGCGMMFSWWPMGEVIGASTIKPFPTSLRELQIRFMPGMKSMALLSNLTSLTHLCLVSCEELTMDGFNPLIAVNLKKLTVFDISYDKQTISIAGNLLSEVARSKLMHAGSFQLEEIVVDSISAVLVAPICSHLAATLHTLEFWYDQRVETFTEEEENALQLLTSLQHLKFNHCKSLRSLPQGLYCLSSLKKLEIHDLNEKNISIAGDLLSQVARSKLMHEGSFQLEEIMVDIISAVLVAPICRHLATSLHRLMFNDQRVETFTEEQDQALQLLTSLQRLEFQNCNGLRSLPQGLHRLPSLRSLMIYRCPKIQSLPPKEKLPASLQVLHVDNCSPELSEQAKKLKGTDLHVLVDVFPCSMIEI